MKAYYRGLSYDLEHLNAQVLPKDAAASFRGHSFKLDNLDIPSTSSFADAQFRGHKVVSSKQQTFPTSRRKSNRLSRTLKSLEGKQVVH
ncbi:MAG: DUF4278 domain-containing protein [Synechococcus sp.]